MKVTFNRDVLVGSHVYTAGETADLPDDARLQELLKAGAVVPAAEAPAQEPEAVAPPVAETTSKTPRFERRG